MMDPGGARELISVFLRHNTVTSYNGNVEAMELERLRLLERGSDYGQFQRVAILAPGFNGKGQHYGEPKHG